MRNSTPKGSRSEQWRKLIDEQERSGLTVRRFCEQQGIGEQPFYLWRKRLRNETPAVRFALVEARTARTAAADSLELILATGERLRIGAGVDATSLRTVLAALRA